MWRGGPQAAGGDAKEIARLEQELAREKTEAAEATATAAKEAEEAKKIAGRAAAKAPVAKAAAAPAQAPARQQGGLIKRIGLPSAAIVALVAAYWVRVGVRLARYFVTGR